MSVGENSLPDTNLLIVENRRSVSDFCFIFYKRLDDSRLLDDQPLLYFTRVYQPQCLACFLPGTD